MDPTEVLGTIQTAIAPVVLISGVGLLLLSLVGAMLVFVRELFLALAALDLTLREPLA